MNSRKNLSIYQDKEKNNKQLESKINSNNEKIDIRLNNLEIKLQVTKVEIIDEV